MSKQIYLLSLFLFVTAMFGVQTVKADGGCPFEMPEVKLPEIPAYTVNIKDFGGVGDGGTVNTEAFAKAMKHLDSKGGGKLVVPAGIWLTGPIQFENCTELHVEQGALVLFTKDFDA